MEERCVADGNERLRFHCSTMLCSLGGGGVCGSPYCCVCSTLRHGFAGKFAFLPVRHAILVCRASWRGASAAVPRTTRWPSTPWCPRADGNDDVELLMFNPEPCSRASSSSTAASQ